MDFRKRLDGLSGICRNYLKENPLSEAVFVFRNKKGQLLRLLVFDGQGQWLCEKRLSEDRFASWPKGEGTKIKLSPRQLQGLLWNGDVDSVKFGADFKKLS